MTIKEEIKKFKELTNVMYETFKKKRNDYGKSTTKAFEEFGPISMYIRMQDKMNRFANLMNNKTSIMNESIYDTLLDLANYALITILEYENFDEAVQKNEAIANLLVANGMPLDEVYDEN